VFVRLFFKQIYARFKTEHLVVGCLPSCLQEERRFDKMKTKTFIIKVLNLISIILFLLIILIIVIKKDI